MKRKRRSSRSRFRSAPGRFGNSVQPLDGRVITEFNYRLSSRDEAHIFVGVSIRSRRDAEELAAHLNQLGYETVDLSDDEMAKLHIRHMVGGRAEGVVSECACRFEFPERPGALMAFLDTLGGRWNISLFHYRNHGADFGRVLAAFEVCRKPSARSSTPFLSSWGTAIPWWGTAELSRCFSEDAPPQFPRRLVSHNGRLVADDLRYLPSDRVVVVWKLGRQVGVSRCNGR